MRFKGVAFTQLPPPDGYGSDAYRALVPMGTIPGFVDGEVVLSESNAIVEYLEENVPTPALLPDAPPGRAMQRSLASIHDGWVEPQIRALYPQVSPKGRDSNKVQTHCELFARRLNEFANYAHGHLADSLTFSDLAWPTTLVHARLLLPVFGFELKLPKALSHGTSASWMRTLLNPMSLHAKRVCTNGLKLSYRASPTLIPARVLGLSSAMCYSTASSTAGPRQQRERPQRTILPQGQRTTT